MSLSRFYSLGAGVSKMTGTVQVLRRDRSHDATFPFAF